MGISYRFASHFLLTKTIIKVWCFEYWPLLCDFPPSPTENLCSCTESNATEVMRRKPQMSLLRVCRSLQGSQVINELKFLFYSHLRRVCISDWKSPKACEHSANIFNGDTKAVSGAGVTCRQCRAKVKSRLSKDHEKSIFFWFRLENFLTWLPFPWGKIDFDFSHKSQTWSDLIKEKVFEDAVSGTVAVAPVNFPFSSWVVSQQGSVKTLSKHFI